MHISDLKTIITPDHAKALLAKNVANRKLSEQTYGQYKRDIINGDWQLNGETIKIAEDGELIDISDHFVGKEFPSASLCLPGNTCKLR